LSQFTQREFLYVDDAMANAENAAKCFTMLAEHCQLPMAKQACLSAAQMHQSHYQRLARHMQNAHGQGAQEQTSANWSSYGQNYQGTYPAMNQGWNTIRNA